MIGFAILESHILDTALFCLQVARTDLPALCHHRHIALAVKTNTQADIVGGIARYDWFPCVFEVAFNHQGSITNIQIEARPLINAVRSPGDRKRVMRNVE